jgi:hypothetical protein
MDERGTIAWAHLSGKPSGAAQVVRVESVARVTVIKVTANSKAQWIGELFLA